MTCPVENSHSTASHPVSGSDPLEPGQPTPLLPKDWFILLLLMVFAVTLRFWKITDLGLTHFDEGSYAMAGKWIATWGREGWAIQAGHAPALFPALVGLYFAAFGVADYVAIAVSATAGSITVALVFVIGSQWFDRMVGTLAALFLAVCEYHLIYSRLALTDATFTLLFWASLAAFYRGIRGKTAFWMILGGLLAGLCWNTKYHGFFPLLVSAVWVAVEILSTTGRGSRLPALKKSHLAPAAALATALFIPWVLAVHLTIGYGPILQGQLSHSSLARGLIVTPPGAVCFYMVSWLAPPLLAGAGLGIAVALIQRRQAGLFLTFTVGLFLSASLFYMSFPRLILPVIPAVCLFAALGLVGTARAAGARPGRLVLVAGTLLILVWSLVRAGPVLQMSTDAYRRAATYIESLEGPVITQLTKNYYFYERRKSLEIRWQRMDDLNRLLEESPSVTLAIDPIIHRLPEIRNWIESLRPRLKLLRRFEVHLYEPLHYQGFDPTLDLDQLPLSAAPSRPGQVFLETYRIVKE